MSEPVFPKTVDDALALLEGMGGPPRLLMHGRLVAEAADALLAVCKSLGVVAARR